MKLKGKAISAPKAKVVAYPREDGDLIFKLVPVINDKEFDRLSPEPKPPTVMRPNQAPFEDAQDPGYLRTLEQRDKLRWDWMLLTTLSATDGLEWEKVKPEDPSTWHLVQQELEESGLSSAEVKHLLLETSRVNVVTEEYVKEARDRFFAGKPQK